MSEWWSQAALAAFLHVELVVSVLQGNCLYHGEVWGVDGSSVAVSTCSGLRYVKTTTHTVHDSSTNGFVYT